MGEVAGPHLRPALAHADVDRDLDLAALHVRHDVLLAVARRRFGERIDGLKREADGRFRLTSDAGTEFLAKAVVIAAGGG